MAVVWEFKQDLRFNKAGKSEDIGWAPYADADSAKIEKAYQKKQAKVKLNDTYTVNLKGNLFQHRNDDFNRQRPVRRVEASAQPPAAKKAKTAKSSEKADSDDEETKKPASKGKAKAKQGAAAAGEEEDADGPDTVRILDSAALIALIQAERAKPKSNKYLKVGPPATEKRIVEAELKMGCKFPAPLRELYKAFSYVVTCNEDDVEVDDQFPLDDVSARSPTPLLYGLDKAPPGEFEAAVLTSHNEKLRTESDDAPEKCAIWLEYLSFGTTDGLNWSEHDTTSCCVRLKDGAVFDHYYYVWDVENPMDGALSPFNTPLHEVWAAVIKVAREAVEAD